MIVADSNVIAYLVIPGPHTEDAYHVSERDSEWIAPPLWQSELINILVQRGKTWFAQSKPEKPSAQPAISSSTPPSTTPRP